MQVQTRGRSGGCGHCGTCMVVLGGLCMVAVTAIVCTDISASFYPIWFMCVFCCYVHVIYIQGLVGAIAAPIAIAVCY